MSINPKHWTFNPFLLSLCRRWPGSWTLNIKTTIKFTTCAVSLHHLSSRALYCLRIELHKQYHCCFQVRKVTTPSSSTTKLNVCSSTTTTSPPWSELTFSFVMCVFLLHRFLLFVIILKCCRLELVKIVQRGDNMKNILTTFAQWLQACVKSL